MSVIRYRAIQPSFGRLCRRKPACLSDRCPRLTRFAIFFFQFDSTAPGRSGQLLGSPLPAIQSIFQDNAHLRMAPTWRDSGDFGRGARHAAWKPFTGCPSPRSTARRCKPSPRHRVTPERGKRPLSATWRPVTAWTFTANTTRLLSAAPVVAPLELSSTARRGCEHRAEPING
jgi:hypothetical protein